MGINYDKLPDGSLKAAIDAALAAENRDAGSEGAKPERCGRVVPNKKKPLEPLVAMPDCPLTVRITGHGVDRYDDDNFSGGCKQLRDAIASALGRKGDGKKDGFEWEYRQKKGEPKTIIEIFERSKK